MQEFDEQVMEGHCLYQNEWRVTVKIQNFLNEKRQANCSAN